MTAVIAQPVVAIELSLVLGREVLVDVDIGRTFDGVLVEVEEDALRQVQLLALDLDVRRPLRVVRAVLTLAARRRQRLALHFSAQAQSTLCLP